MTPRKPHVPMRAEHSLSFDGICVTCSKPIRYTQVWGRWEHVVEAAKRKAKEGAK